VDIQIEEDTSLKRIILIGNGINIIVELMKKYLILKWAKSTVIEEDNFPEDHFINIQGEDHGN